MPVLLAFREDRFGFQFRIEERALLGRAPECDLILFDRATSRTHAEIRKTEDGFILEDLGSTNGTYHNENRLEGGILLKNNDEIRIGQEVFLFNPALDVAVGREGAVLLVGNTEADPEGVYIGLKESDLSALDRSNLAPLYQIAVALANRPNKQRVLKQAAYAVTKLFKADRLVLLWPKNGESQHFTVLLSRPENQRAALPRSVVTHVIENRHSVIWPTAISSIDFSKGERFLSETPASVMCTPLKAHNDAVGLLYVESREKKYTEKDLNFLAAIGALIAPALINSALIAELDYRLAAEEQELDKGGSFVGDDHQIKALLGTAYQVGITEARIMLTGEVGTGKEVLARRIHAQSPRRRGPFISVNCSAHPPGMIEAILFGQEAGAMSEEGDPGMLEKADGGTIFLRHVDHLPLSCQVELLRSMEEGLVYRLGASRPVPSNFRTITSTSADIDEMVMEGEFREDLLHRLAEVTLEMPPLREIKADIQTLSRHFLDKSARERGIAVPELDPAVSECLLAYPWPGNVGELKNAADKLVMFSRNNRLVLEDLPPELRLAPETFTVFDEDYESEIVKDVQKIYIRRALARTNGNVESACEILGIGLNVLEDFIQRYNISTE